MKGDLWKTQLKSEDSKSRNNLYYFLDMFQTVLSWRYIPIIVAVLVLIPIGTVMLSFLTPAGEIWQHLVETTLSRLLLNSFWLALGVAVSSTLLGVSLAWFTAVCDFPGRKIFLGDYCFLLLFPHMFWHLLL